MLSLFQHPGGRRRGGRGLDLKFVQGDDRAPSPAIQAAAKTSRLGRVTPAAASVLRVKFRPGAWYRGSRGKPGPVSPKAPKHQRCRRAAIDVAARASPPGACPVQQGGAYVMPNLVREPPSYSPGLQRRWTPDQVRGDEPASTGVPGVKGGEPGFTRSPEGPKRPGRADGRAGRTRLVRERSDCVAGTARRVRQSMVVPR
jgi:hypothetical protein